jgi:DNA ligase-associated metallophosphoesterase
MNAAAELPTQGGHRLHLRADGSAFCPATRTLFAADLHLGKGAAFRAQGQPVPRGSSAATLARLSAALTGTKAQRLVVLGDFWHSPRGRSEALLEQLHTWRAAHAIQALLVAGNHDRGSAPPPGFEEVPEPWPLAGTPLVGHHHPPGDGSGGFALAGHLHPALTLRGAGRLRAFLATAAQLVLPAYGDFTGAFDVGRERPPGSRVWVCGDGAIWALPRR